jgi:hypothetical protein
MKIIWIIIYAFCSVFMVIGALLCWNVMKAILKGRALENWPTAEAQVLSCELVDNSAEGVASFEVRAQYSYTIDGREYVSEKIHPGYGSSSAEGHHVLFRKMKSASRVLVYYNAETPSESYLIAGNFGFHTGALFAGLLFFFAGLFFLLMFHYSYSGTSNYADRLTVTKTVEQPTAANALPRATER